jgi:hypothetical protein
LVGSHGIWGLLPRRKHREANVGSGRKAVVRCGTTYSSTARKAALRLVTGSHEFRIGRSKAGSSVVFAGQPGGRMGLERPARSAGASARSPRTRSRCPSPGRRSRLFRNGMPVLCHRLHPEFSLRARIRDGSPHALSGVDVGLAAVADARRLDATQPGFHRAPSTRASAVTSRPSSAGR